MKTPEISNQRVSQALDILQRSLAGANPAANTPNASGRVAGFWLGLWHGVIAPITLIISLFSDKVHVYEVHNNGAWYIFGFILGLVSIWGGGGRAGATRRGPVQRSPVAAETAAGPAEPADATQEQGTA